MIRRSTGRTGFAAAGLVLLVLLALAPSAAADLVVTRRVGGDELSSPSRVGGFGGCVERPAPPAAGDEVRLSVTPGAARRDEPQLSVIVRLDDGVGLVVDHATHTYSRLRFPPAPRQLAGPMRANMGPSAEEVYPYEPLGELERHGATVVGRASEVRERTVESPFLGRLDVELTVLPDPGLARAAFAVESLTEAIRNDGESWLGLLGDADGVPLSITRVRHLPSAQARYEEAVTEVEEREIDPSLFEAPEGYEKVRFDAGCY